MRMPQGHREVIDAGGSGVNRQINLELTVILFLGAISAGCIFGVVVLEGFNKGGQSETLQTIASLCVGALASRITQSGAVMKPHSEGGEDADLTIIGRAATRSMIAQAVKQLAEGEKKE